MAPLTHLFLLLSMAFAASAAAASAAAASPKVHSNATQLMKDACDKTLHKELCLQTLTSTNKAATSDIRGLATIAIQGALRKATRNAAHISILLDRYHPPTLQQCISDCSESYEDVVEQLNDSVGALNKLPENDEDDIITWISAAMSDAQTCEDGCQGQAVEKNILTLRNTEFGNLCSNALAIVKQVPTKN